MNHPAYDEFWQDQALDKILAAARRDRAGHVGPQSLGPGGYLRQHRALQGAQGAASGHFESVSGDRPLVSPSATARRQCASGRFALAATPREYFRKYLLRPFFDHYLKDDAPPLDMAPVTAFETGMNRWQSLPTWPSGCESGCAIAHAKALFAKRRRSALERVRGFGAADRARADGFESYIADPAKPVPYLPRPIHIGGEEGEMSWQTWLVSDQRDVASRTDVLSFATPVLRGAAENQRRTHRQPHRLHFGNRRRLRGEIDRCLSRRGRARTEDGRLSVDGFSRHFARPLPRFLQQSQADSSRTRSRCFALRCRPPTTCSCRVTASWFRFSRAGFRCTTETRRPMSTTSSLPNPATIRRRR